MNPNQTKSVKYNDYDCIFSAIISMNIRYNNLTIFSYKPLKEYIYHLYRNETQFFSSAHQNKFLLENGFTLLIVIIDCIKSNDLKQHIDTYHIRLLASCLFFFSAQRFGRQAFFSEFDRLLLL